MQECGRAMLPSNFPEVSGADATCLRRMFRLHLDMQLEDLRVLLRLPNATFTAGCNFVAASHLFNLISGFSVCLYDASPTSLAGRDRSKRFRRLVTRYFPWGDSGVAAIVGAEVFYTYARNPLTHALGLDDPAAPGILISKRRLTSGRIIALEDSPTRPRWAAPALTVRPPYSDEDGAERDVDDYELSVAGCYWGTHRMLHALLGDPIQRAGAESLASSLGF